jgi:hypothetical protein
MFECLCLSKAGLTNSAMLPPFKNGGLKVKQLIPFVLVLPPHYLSIFVIK